MTSLLRALWTRSPADLVSAVTRRFTASPSSPARSSQSTYYLWLVDQMHAFVAASHPADVLPLDRFRALVAQYANPAWLKPSNRYVGDLWYLFEPDFQRRLDDYYRYQDLQLTTTLLSYANNPALLASNYLRPYQIAHERLGQGTVVEIGAGLPHGFLHQYVTPDVRLASSLVTVDIDGTPARFVEWFCRSRQVPHRWITAVAGATPDLSGIGAADFVFAKDVFEHLVDPVPVIDALLRTASARAVLALDLDDKGPVVYQHVSPDLSPLRTRVLAAGFRLLEHTGNMSIYVRSPEETFAP